MSFAQSAARRRAARSLGLNSGQILRYDIVLVASTGNIDTRPEDRPVPGVRRVLPVRPGPRARLPTPARAGEPPPARRTLPNNRRELQAPLAMQSGCHFRGIRNYPWPIRSTH
jgi:hypothetical protein